MRRGLGNVNRERWGRGDVSACCDGIVLVDGSAWNVMD